VCFIGIDRGLKGSISTTQPKRFGSLGSVSALKRGLRIARISQAELKRQLDAGEPVVIVDLRTALDVAATPFGIPGALRVAPEELERRHQEIPRDRDIVLYCS
jgi:hypothetical protein